MGESTFMVEMNETALKRRGGFHAAQKVYAKAPIN